MAGPRVYDLYAYGLVQHIPHKSYMAQIYYATTFAVFYFPFADPSRIFRGHMLKPFYINANTRTFRSMLIYIYIYYIYTHTHTYMYAHTHTHCMRMLHVYLSIYPSIHPSPVSDYPPVYLSVSMPACRCAHTHTRTRARPRRMTRPSTSLRLSISPVTESSHRTRQTVNPKP